MRKKIDIKALSAEHIVAQNSLSRAENTDGLGGKTAEQIREYYKIARSKALIDPKAELQFHRFDGTGFFHFRFPRPGSNTDGMTFDELFS